MAKQVKIDIVARDKTKQAIDKSKRGLSGLKTAAIAVSAALATIGAGRALKGLVNTGKEIESLQIRFKLLFGSAEEGAKAFDTLTDFAAKVPFSLQDIAAASGNLAVVAKDAKQLNDILEITGNVAGATGLDFQTTASQIQRAFAGGIASADIFREKGVRDMLGFSAGAKVSVEETREAFARVFAGNGEFAKTTEELATTLEGTLSMINDKFFNFQLAINRSFFEELKNQFGDLNKFLEANEAEIEAFGEDIGQALAGSLIALANAVKIVKDNFEEFELALGAILIASGGLVKILAGLGLAYDSITSKQKELLDMTNSYNESLFMQETGMNNINAVHDAYLKNQKEILEVNDRQVESIASINREYEKTIEQLGLLNDAQIAVMNSFEAQKEASREAHRTEAQTAEQAAQKNIEAFKNSEFEKINTKKVTDKQLRQMGRHTLQEGAKINKELFRLNQALNIGEAIMNTAKGVTAALPNIPLALAIGAFGAVQVATIASQQPPAQFGGIRQAGSPFLVGEKGAELFTPATAGTVTPAHQMPSGSTVVNFNINTVSAKGFNELLNNSRGMITNMINQAVNEKGKANLI